MTIDTEFLKQLALEAGEIILGHYRNAEGIEIDRKADNSPLTVADRDANDHIVKALRAKYPSIPIISEEEKLTPWSERADWDMCFEVDPLDGTKEFIKRNGEFTVNIALIRQGVPIAGVVHAPVLGLNAVAEQGAGAFLDEGGEGRRLQSRFPRVGEPLVIVASRSHMSAEVEDYVSRFTDPIIQSAGSSLKFLLVAKGEAHLYPRLAPTMEWDTSAGHCVLTEAGGQVMVHQTDQPLVYNRPDLLNPHFIAYAAGMREWLAAHTRV